MTAHIQFEVFYPFSPLFFICPPCRISRFFYVKYGGDVEERERERDTLA